MFNTMKRSGLLLTLVIFCVPSFGLAQSVNIKEIIERESPGVVAIFNFDSENNLQGSGSGFIVSSDGKLVTNYHVIEGAASLLVKTKTGEIYDRLWVIDVDQRRDIAVLQLRAIGLATVSLADAEDLVVQGDWCVAIGNPAGLEHTVSDGIVSAVRVSKGTKMIQVTAPISPGSSGGPLFDSQGNVVGITTSLLAGENNQNLNFAIPIKYALPMLDADTQYTLAEIAPKETSDSQVGTPVSAQNNTYTDPNGYLTVTIPEGWYGGPSDVADGVVFQVTNGTSSLFCTFWPNIQALNPFYTNFRNGALETYKRVKLQNHFEGVTDVDEYPGVIDIYNGKYEGNRIQILAGGFKKPNGVAICMAVSPFAGQGVTHPDMTVAYAMFAGLR